MTEMHDRRPPMPVSEEEDTILPPPRCVVETPDVRVKETPLHDAAADGDVEKAREWLELGVDVNAQNRHGNTALHIAARDGRAEVVKLLRAQKDIDETIENHFGQKPQDCAKDEAVKAVFAQAIKKSGIRLPTELPKSEEEWISIEARLPCLLFSIPFFLLGMVGSMGGIVRLLAGQAFPIPVIMVGALVAVAQIYVWIAEGHDSKCSEEHKRKCKEIKTRERGLSFAIKMGVLDEVKRGLVDGLNPSGCEDNIPLHMAVAVGNAEIVRELLAHGADPNAKDAEGYTPVFRAIIAKKGEVVKALLESPNTDLDIANNDGQIPRNFMCLVEKTKLPEERRAEPRKAQKPQMPELKL